MLLTLAMPRFVEQMRAGKITRCDVTEGDVLSPGAVLFEVLVDLAEGLRQDCPPVIHQRIISRERGVVRRVAAAPGQEVSVGALLLVVERDDVASERKLRVASYEFAPDPFSCPPDEGT